MLCAFLAPWRALRELYQIPDSRNAFAPFLRLGALCVSCIKFQILETPLRLSCALALCVSSIKFQILETPLRLTCALARFA
jgi:hypothetical protein